MICSKIFQKSTFLSKNPIVEVGIMYIFGIMSYMLAEILEMSGVITVLVCGICLAHFNFYNLSVTGQIATGYLLIHMKNHFSNCVLYSRSLCFYLLRIIYNVLCSAIQILIHFCPSGVGYLCYCKIYLYFWSFFNF